MQIAPNLIPFLFPLPMYFENEKHVAFYNHKNMEFCLENKTQGCKPCPSSLRCPQACHRMEERGRGRLISGPDESSQLPRSSRSLNREPAQSQAVPQTSSLQLPLTSGYKSALPHSAVTGVSGEHRRQSSYRLTIWAEEVWRSTRFS